MVIAGGIPVVATGGVLVVNTGDSLVGIAGGMLVVTNGGKLDVVLITGGTLVVGTTEDSLVLRGDEVLSMIDGVASLDGLSELSCVGIDVVTAPIGCREVVLS